MYEEYKNEYNTYHSRTFFNQHKDEEWFKDKYDPQRIKVWYPIKVEKAKQDAEKFFNDFSDGNIKISFNADENEILVPDSARNQEQDSKGENEINVNENDINNETEESPVNQSTQNNDNNNVEATEPKEENATERDETDIEENKDDEASPTLFIKTISPQCSRQDLYDTLSKVESGTIVKLVISDPSPNKNWHRIGWVTYSSVDASKEALEKLSGTKMDNFELNLIYHKEKPGDKKAKITPSIASQPDRISHDLSQIKTLIQLMDSEKGIKNNLLLDEHKEMNDEQLLDILIYYLRKVHCYCYYSAEEFDNYDNLVMKCGEIYLRGTEKYHSNADPNTWTQNLDNKIKWRLENTITLETLTGVTFRDKFEESICRSHTNQVSDVEFRCTYNKCTKKFYAFEFLQKHLKNKHPELWEDFDEKLMEEQYFQNYLNDPKRVTPSSLAIQNMLQSGSNTPLNKNKRDERGSRRSKSGFSKGRGNWTSQRGSGYVDLDDVPKDNIEIDYSFQLAKFREKRKREKE